MKHDVETVYMKYRDMVWRVALNYSCHPSDAEDILQDVFLSYFKSDMEFNDETHLKAWLLRVSINACKNLFRSPWKRRVLPLEEIAGSSNYQALSPPEREEYLELQELLLQLKPLDRNLIYLLYYEELSLKEIAEILQKSEPSLRTRLYRLRKQLAIDLIEGEKIHEY